MFKYQDYVKGFPAPLRHKIRYNNFIKTACQFFDYEDVDGPNKVLIVNNPDLHIYNIGMPKVLNSFGYNYYYRPLFTIVYDYANFKIYRIGKKLLVKYFKMPESSSIFYDTSTVVRFKGKTKFLLTPLGKLEIYEEK